MKIEIYISMAMGTVGSALLAGPEVAGGFLIACAMFTFATIFLP